MKRTIYSALVSSLVGGSLALSLTPSPAPVRDCRSYEVTIQNLTRGQIFSPLLVALHDDDVSLFRPGSPASDELALLAEEGDNSALFMDLSRDRDVDDVVSGRDVLLPGQREVFTLDRDRRGSHVSLAAMMVSTNDAFVGANAIRLPRGRETVDLELFAYDAGSEFNSEDCAFVPGPPCGSAGAHDPRPGEGYVHYHAGIHGIGGLMPSEVDWRGPVARVVIRPVRRGDDD